MVSPSRGWDAGSCDARPRISVRKPRRAVPAELGVERGVLLRRARDLAERRAADRSEALAEIEQLKQVLRASAERVAARERELAEREARLGEREEEEDEQRGPRLRRRRREEHPGPTHEDALAARAAEFESRGRELAARAEAIAARERELAEREKAVEQEQRGGRLRLPRRSERREAA